ncbi:3-deoxy-manno-octulosonate cytidylyltransferase [Paenibacillus tarimensis]
MLKTIAIIPARYASTRFPGKPLVDIQGISMIERVYRNVEKARNIDEVWVATDDGRIEDKVLSFGGKCIMTSTTHQTGSDRIAEAIEKLRADVVVNVQGDEPLIEGDVLEQLVEPFVNDQQLKMSTLKTKIVDSEEVQDPNVVKVITDETGKAIYFSRSPIPYNRDNRTITYFKHIGVYAYRYDFLSEYVKMKQTPLEIAESLEQLRVIENGIQIQVVETDHKFISVDTPSDLDKVNDFLLSIQGVGNG